MSQGKLIECGNCKEIKPHDSRGLCHNCYVRLARNGKLLEHPIVGYYKGGRSIITCNGCGKLSKLEARGLCRNCYANKQQKENKKEKPTVICLFCGQSKKLQSKGLCKACYNRAWKNNGIPRGKKKRPITIGECQDCKEVARLTKSKCKRCYLNFLRRNNPEKYKAYADKYKNSPKHKENALKNKRLRRSRIKGVESTLTEREWQDILEKYNYSCAYCGIKEDNLHREHWIPLIKGGGYTKENIVPSCKKCNVRKHTMMGEEYLQLLEKEKGNG